MPYATEAKFDASFSPGERQQLLTGREGGFEQVAQDADGEIHSYLATRYAVPVDPAPSRLVAVALDIARYRLYDDAAPDTVQKRYEAAIKWLRDLAAGKAALTADDGSAIPEAEAPTSGPVSPNAPARDLTFDAAFRGRYRLGAL
ncbi:MAG: DUF1320 domain-containing protein [Proteobacteria bacterium]|nr:DUF1320 domain-containing protein [Pseudomonadota bacterium]